MKELSVIIPAYNEEERLEGTVRDAARYLDERGYKHEIIVIDDGSRDQTPVLLKKLSDEFRQLRWLRLSPNQGKGRAVQKGIEEARLQWCLFMDADNSTSIREWDKFEPLMQAGAAAVAGSRRLPGSIIAHAQPAPRRILGGIYRFLCRALLGLDGTDFNCGFKAYRTELAKKVYARVCMTDWSFDVEVLARLKKEEGVIPKEVPVQWSHAEKKSNLAPFSSGIKTFGSLLRLSALLRKG